MNRRSLMFFAVFIAAVPCLAQQATTATVTLDDFAGKWMGKWNDNLKVQFTISSIDQEKARVLYQWEESRGTPMRTTSMLGWIEDAKLKVGRIITIELSAAEQNRATARGDFKSTRTATLIRTVP